jgi:hypothetical protein
MSEFANGGTYCSAIVNLWVQALQFDATRRAVGAEMIHPDDDESAR